MSFCCVLAIIPGRAGDPVACLLPPPRSLPYDDADFLESSGPDGGAIPETNLALASGGSDSGWLLSVGPSPATALRQSRLIAHRIESMSEPSGAFAASPRILSPLGGPGWLACGTAGLAFDPLCGDGTAHAMREAILAVAVVRAILSGGDATLLLSHYEARLTAGFQRHLAVTMDFYRSGNCGKWWDQETAFLQQGLEWCARKLVDHGPFRYQLTGFELRPIDNRPAYSNARFITRDSSGT